MHHTSIDTYEDVQLLIDAATERLSAWFSLPYDKKVEKLYASTYQSRLNLEKVLQMDA